MTERGTPVVILFIIVTGVLLYNYVAQYRLTNGQLREEIILQQDIIDKQKQANKSLATMIQYMYYKQHGQLPPQNMWVPIKPKSELSPVH